MGSALVLLAHILATSITVTGAYQAKDADLTAIAGANPAANQSVYWTGAGAVSTYSLTAAGRALIDDADATAQRTTLGLGALATGASATDVAFTPAVNADWSGAADPGQTDDALDQLASRVTTLEGAGSGSNVYDWTASMAALNLADWTDVADAGNGWGGTTALNAFASKTDPANHVALVATVSTQTGNGRGFARTVAAGDFIRGFRLSLAVDGKRPGEALTVGAIAVFVDGADVSTDTFYGAGLYVPADTWQARQFRSVQGTWNSYGSGNASSISTAAPDGVVDVFLERSGTTLNAYGCAPGGIPHLIDTWTVTAGAGEVGLYFIQNTAGATVYGALLAYASPASVPGR